MGGRGRLFVYVLAVRGKGVAMDPGFKRVNAPPIRIKRGFTLRFRVAGIYKTALEQKSIGNDENAVLVEIRLTGWTRQK